MKLPSGSHRLLWCLAGSSAGLWPSLRSACRRLAVPAAGSARQLISTASALTTGSGALSAGPGSHHWLWSPERWARELGPSSLHWTLCCVWIFGMRSSATVSVFRHILSDVLEINRVGQGTLDCSLSAAAEASGRVTFPPGVCAPASAAALGTAPPSTVWNASKPCQASGARQASHCFPSASSLVYLGEFKLHPERSCLSCS